MRSTWNYERLANELDSQAILHRDLAEKLDEDGKEDAANLARRASLAVRAVQETIYELAKRVAAIQAHLRDGETIEDFVAAAVAAELARRDQAAA